MDEIYNILIDQCSNRCYRIELQVLCLDFHQARV